MTSISTLADLENVLGTEPDLPVIFSARGVPISPGYHVTELRYAPVSAIDCGGNTDTWADTTLGRVASITGQARSTLTRENGQPTDSNLAQPSSVILLRARTPICASVF